MPNLEKVYKGNSAKVFFHERLLERVMDNSLPVCFSKFALCNSYNYADEPGRQEKKIVNTLIASSE
jgi:hypothetical protein